MSVLFARTAACAMALWLFAGAALAQERATHLAPSAWPDGGYERFLKAQDVDRTKAGVAIGRRGAVTVAYNGIAARAGLEALRHGGNAIDAAMTTVLTQVAITAGAPISYFGMLSLVYYDAKSANVYTMNAEWNTVRGETDPMSIPGGINMASDEGLRGTAVSGRTALVGGFMKGVGAAHARFGKLPFGHLFEPAIYIAEQGMPVTARLAEKIRFRSNDLKRLPETRAVFMKDDGSFYAEGDIFRQPALAQTLRAISAQGTDYMYKGPWAAKLVAALAADEGKMTLDDLAGYDVIWDEPLIAAVGDYQIQTNPPPNLGGVGMIEAQNLAAASGLSASEHWSRSGPSLRTAVDVAQMAFVNYLPEPTLKQLYPGIDFGSGPRMTQQHAVELWSRIKAGAKPFQWELPCRSIRMT